MRPEGMHDATAVCSKGSLPGVPTGEVRYAGRHQGRHPGEKDQAANRKEKGRRGGRPVTHDTDLYKDRNTIERMINKLKAGRGIATRDGKTSDSYLVGPRLRACMIWIKDLIRANR
jgi:hypothetical protein